jgi:predicted DNA-binding protein (MmcQ/YjbR family)
VLGAVLDGIGRLPEAGPQETWGIVTLRVRGKIFGWFVGGLDGAERWLAFKPAPSEMAAFAEDPRMRREPHSQHWFELNLDQVADWDEVMELLTDAYALVAPKELADRVGGRPR